MPLPESGSSLCWPPESYKSTAADQAEASAWYSGDTNALMRLYGTADDAQRGTRGRWSSFWSRRSLDSNTSRQKLHVPVGGDIAATSADLLFGDAPVFVVPEAHRDNATDAEGNVIEVDKAGAQLAEDRLAQLMYEDGWAALLLEAAEVCAGIGQVYLRPMWDATTSSHAMLSIVHGDRAVPEYRWGYLVAVTFWREIEATYSPGKDILRHLERHEPGVIMHGLYKGTSELLGVRMPLNFVPELGMLAVDEAEEIRLPAPLNKTLLPRAVPNILPNRKRRGLPVGRADSQGLYELMDALDETYTSWMRDIRLGKGRIIVPNEFLEKNGRGQGSSFDLDAEVYSPLEMDPASQEKASITLSQFEIRTEQHAATAMALFEKIVTLAGYSTSSFGLGGEGSAQTATEVDAREGKSARTTAKKRRYWQKAIEDVGEIILQLDQVYFSSKVPAMRPVLEFGGEAEQDIKEMAATLNLLTLAKAASIYIRVKMLHPKWDEATIQAEVALIEREQGSAPMDDPTGGVGEF